MQYLKQSTAATVLVGPVLDADGAAVTSAVIGDFRLSKNGTVATMAGNAIAHDHNGMYRITLTEANTDTVDRLTISVGNTAYGMTAFRYTVLTAAQYDALIANGTITPAAIEAALVNEGDATALLQAIADKIAGDLTAGDLTALAIVSAIKADATLAQMISRIDVATSTRLASGSYTAPPTAATVASAVWDKATVDHTSTGSFGAAIGALSAATGAGARTVTITVNDGTTALQNARVRLTNGAETYTGLTNVSGVVVFNVDDNDWIVSITKAGYSYSGTTLTVNGTETATYSMTLISLTASDVDKVTGYWTVLDEEGNEASGIVVTIKARQASRGSAGALHDAATRTATSAVNGLVQFPNMIPGWRYSVVANDEYVADFTVPADAVTSVELGSIVARLT